MIKSKYKLFPKRFVNGIIKTIQTSENLDAAKENLKIKFDLDDLEVKCILSFKLPYLIELVRSNNLKHFIRRLKDIHLSLTKFKLPTKNDKVGLIVFKYNQ